MNSAILSAVGRDAGVAGALLVAAHGEDPVAVAREVQDEADDERDDGDPPEERHLELAADERRRTAALAIGPASSATLVVPVR